MELFSIFKFLLEFKIFVIIFVRKWKQEFFNRRGIYEMKKGQINYLWKHLSRKQNPREIRQQKPNQAQCYLGLETANLQMQMNKCDANWPKIKQQSYHFQMKIKSIPQVFEKVKLDPITNPVLNTLSI